jgi:uncharacterized protein YjiS (DUF1127 family)
MSTTSGTIKLAQTASTRCVFSFFTRLHWDAFQERRKRVRLRVVLCDLNTRELQDIGITRGEIDYVVAKSDVDLRRIDRPVR